MVFWMTRWTSSSFGTSGRLECRSSSPDRYSAVQPHLTNSEPYSMLPLRPPDQVVPSLWALRGRSQIWSSCAAVTLTVVGEGFWRGSSSRSCGVSAVFTISSMLASAEGRESPLPEGEEGCRCLACGEDLAGGEALALFGEALKSSSAMASSLSSPSSFDAEILRSTFMSKSRTSSFVTLLLPRTSTLFSTAAVTAAAVENVAAVSASNTLRFMDSSRSLAFSSLKSLGAYSEGSIVHSCSGVISPSRTSKVRSGLFSMLKLWLKDLSLFMYCLVSCFRTLSFVFLGGVYSLPSAMVTSRESLYRCSSSEIIALCSSVP